MAKIVHFAKYFYPEKGGIESVTLSLSRAAAVAGYLVTVVCFQRSKVREIDDAIAGLRILRTPVSIILSSQPLSVKYFIKCLWSAKGADIVHLHMPNMLAAFCALFLERKTLVLVHWHSDVINKGIIGILIRPLEYFLLRRADSIIATSRAYSDASTTLALFQRKITVVPIGVSVVKHEVTNFRLSLLEDERIKGKKIILAVGRLVPYKGFLILINAAKNLCNDSVVVIVGSGPLEYELHQAIAISGANERVVLAGRLSDAALHELFLQTAVYCLPSTSRAEAFGVVLLEAMSYGLPIVATDIPGSGVPWVNQHGVSGLNVQVGDVNALVTALNKILTCDRLRRRLSYGARQRFLTEFVDDVSNKRMFAIYDTLLSR